MYNPSVQILKDKGASAEMLQLASILASLKHEGKVNAQFSEMILNFSSVVAMLQDPVMRMNFK